MLLLHQASCSAFMCMSNGKVADARNHASFWGTISNHLSGRLAVGQELERLHARIAPHFARPEPRRRALAFLKGIVSPTERKNGWRLAEHAGESCPDGMQRLLTSAIWDADRVRDDLRAYILERLGASGAVVIIDETSFRKSGHKSAGVGMQHCGTTGQVENCQVAVFLAYSSAKGCTLLDRELYLPMRWTEDRKRCQEAGIPDAADFQTKPELARRMLSRLYAAHVPIAWVVADSVYGGNADLRTWLEEHQYCYVGAVANTEAVGIQTATGRKRLTVIEAEVRVLSASDWQRLSMSEGSKGPRWFDWAVVPILHRWEDDGQHWLLIRRRLDDPTEKTFYLVFAPKGTTLAEMVQALGARWSIETCFETSKEMGMDHYEVRGFTAWYRFMTLVMVVMAALAGICAAARASPSEQAHAPTMSSLRPLTIPEVRHLLATLLWPLPRSAILVLHWSWWRRCHQSRASVSHTKRRSATR